MELFILFLSAILVNNFVLSRFLGICPFLGVSKKVETAVGMGMAVTFVMTLASMITYIVYNWILVPFKIEYLYTIAFILVIASLVQFVEMVIQKISPTLYQALGVYLPLITTNCAVLGVAVLNMNEGYNLIQSIVHGVGAALGFTLAIVLFAGIRERIENNNILTAFQGFPIALITAGLMSIAFLGFQGLL
ncbi:electron transport complex subunit RsxA [Defluviitalea raffinosedens]|jgi:electron transport complex protein RnfA|uniref:Ion-translocating oxidoreductase complex subunit A n=1 Tax=Defluviitalea raffinosedens TaxID=1450156 RepID=A0A7C8HHG1_9FIRM|nr:electron transport complex subunit RsxA [Defluviitalea raffinosedens]KAE9637312.1 electron transport complex subunit RsxA [Defluviitalea raffinosedens]MBM7685618.1 electron transport complex protein RnfA [Defluviitalea raffinosedens]MBZ4668902.1 rsxA [Defluviitaleaceae bacterium]HHW66653.1 electron transport complex subunit RsxA [Candidatus Epulonipiscium sp.]